MKNFFRFSIISICQLALASNLYAQWVQTTGPSGDGMIQSMAKNDFWRMK